MVDAYVTEYQPLARLHGVLLTTARYDIDGVYRHGFLAYVWLVVKLARGVKPTFTEGDPVSIEHSVCPVVENHIAGPMILLASRGQRARKEDLLNDKVLNRRHDAEL